MKGEGNQQDYGMRIYDPRLGRFLSVDPLTKSYPMLTPYQFASNTPIWAIDLDGAEAWMTNDGSNNVTFGPLSREEAAKRGLVAAKKNPKAAEESPQFLPEDLFNPTWEEPWQKRPRTLIDDGGAVGSTSMLENGAKVTLTAISMVPEDLGNIGEADGVSAFIPIYAPVGNSIDAFQKHQYIKGTLNVALGWLDIYGTKSLAAGALSKFNGLAKTETFYRAMSHAEYSALESTGGLSAMPGKELFISTKEWYSTSYLKPNSGYDLLVQFNVNGGTLEQLSAMLLNIRMLLINLDLDICRN